jgi:DNA-binding HxlR family transcriptional regulator
VSQQLVVKAIQILGLLFEQNPATGMSVNEIFRQTSSKDKPLVINSIKYLEKAKLVETDEKVHHKQRKIKILTQLGYTFAELIHSLDKYNESYEKLKIIIKQNFDLSIETEKSVLVNILRSRGWKPTEYNKYKKLHEAADILLFELSPHQNIDSLLIRYVSLLAHPTVIDNENAKVILNKITMDLLYKQLSVIQKDLMENTTSSPRFANITNKDEQLFDYFANQKFAVLDTLFYYDENFYDGKTLDIRFIKQPAKEVLLSILNILKPSRRAIDIKYDVLGDIIHTYLEEEQSGS